MTTYRIERDSMGDVRVPEAALYQAQTQRAVDNFPISGLTMPTTFIQALALIKQAAAKANAELALLETDIADAIVSACQEIIDGQHLTQFPVDVFQTGSGTSSNMNANEVIATLASQKLGKTVNPNDHVNMGQSSNDVVPTAIAISASLATEQELIPALQYLSQAIESKAQTLENVVKTGRTHLMDAMPVTLAQELRGWKYQIDAASNGIQQTLPQVKALAQGGTAVGTGINAVPAFSGLFAKHLSATTKSSFKPSDNFFYNMSSQDAIVSLSGQLKTAAVAIMKIANDLRWMNSGPLAGLGEIEPKLYNQVHLSCQVKLTLLFLNLQPWWQHK